MWGVEFKEASNAMICGSATFEVRKLNGQHRQVSKIYRVLFGPHEGMTIQHKVEGEWQPLKRRAEPEDLEAILPQGDFMHKWTYGDFMIAMTFFDQGHRMGYNQCRWDVQKVK